MISSAAFADEFADLLAKAKEGDVAAQIQAAEKYEKGEGVAKSSKEAAGWYQKAAEQGNGDAQLSLGKIFISGRGMRKSSTEAAKWFRLAAEQGRAVAQIQMARMHLAGAGVVKDDVEAWRWASLAAAQGDKQATKILAFVRPRLTAEQRFNADEMVRTALEKKTADDAAKGVPSVAPPIDPPVEP